MATKGRAVAHMAGAMHYKLEDRGFDSPWGHLHFSLA